MNTTYFFKKQILSLFAIMLLGLISQSVNAAYDNANYTIEEVIQLNKKIIAKQQAERIRKKNLLIMQERKRQQAHQQRVQQKAPRHQYRAPRQQQYRAPPVSRPISAVPAWRRSASHTMTRSADDALFGAAKTRDMTLLMKLIAEGANINHKNFNGESTLHIAASLGNLQMVRYLLSKGAQVNIATGKSWLPIHHAIRFKHPVVANYLIGRRASVWAKNSDGFSALDFAAKSKDRRIQAIARRYGR